MSLVVRTSPWAHLPIALAALLAFTGGCSDLPDEMDMPLDAGMDVTEDVRADSSDDDAEADASPDSDTDAAADSGEQDAGSDAAESDASEDTSPDVPCECEPLSDCEEAACNELGECVRTPVRNGTTCEGDGRTYVCIEGLCSPPMCGDGVRESTASGVEGCDDGNRADGDGCSSMCEPEERVRVTYEDGLIQTGAPRPFIGIDDDGHELLVYTELEGSLSTARMVLDGGEPMDFVDVGSDSLYVIGLPSGFWVIARDRGWLVSNEGVIGPSSEVGFGATIKRAGPGVVRTSATSNTATFYDDALNIAFRVSGNNTQPLSSAPHVARAPAAEASAGDGGEAAGSVILMAWPEREELSLDMPEILVQRFVRSESGSMTPGPVTRLSDETDLFMGRDGRVFDITALGPDRFQLIWYDSLGSQLHASIIDGGEWVETIQVGTVPGYFPRFVPWGKRSDGTALGVLAVYDDAPREGSVEPSLQTLFISPALREDSPLGERLRTELGEDGLLPIPQRALEELEGYVDVEVAIAEGPSGALIHFVDRGLGDGDMTFDRIRSLLLPDDAHLFEEEGDTP